MPKKIVNSLSLDDQQLWKAYTDWLFFHTPRLVKNKKASIDSPIENVLDLHGLTVQEAYQSTISFLSKHQKIKTKKVIIICGKSGQISKELKHWIDRLEFIKDVIPNIDKKKEVGSYTILFHKSKL